MARQIVDLKGLSQALPLTAHQVYKLVRNPVHPLPHRKAGKRLLFDLEQVFKWFDELPGAGGMSEK
ncbi:MAG: hypothetical protein K9N21_02765 [Deltaproteobacteria bacterium]|nr:hypothetical protein [Deltaproteobacteria bacterium]